MYITHHTKLGEIEVSQIQSLNCLEVTKNTVPITINCSLKSLIQWIVSNIL